VVAESKVVILQFIDQSQAGGGDRDRRDGAQTQVAAGTAAIGLSVSTASSVFGEPVMLVAQVTSRVTPGGTVTFFNGGDALGTIPLCSSGDAVQTTSDLAAGPHAVTAAYCGGASLSGANSGSAKDTYINSPVLTVCADCSSVMT
jgi:Bacterial Ig-like domain (group 3)